MKKIFNKRTLAFVLGLVLILTVPFCFAASAEPVETGDVAKASTSSSAGEYATDYEVTTLHSVTSGDAVVGAVLQILDADGNVVKEWTTGTDSYTINGVLVAGAEYTLHEVSAPAGFCLADDVKFTVNTDGSINNITMEDAPTDITIIKYSAVTKEPLAGAVLQIIDADGKVVKEWTTDGTAVRLQGLLVAGAEYTLHEVSAPEGYCLADDVKFTVPTDADEQGIVVEMINVGTTVEISKTSLVDGKELAGATLQIIDADGKVVKEWVTNGTKTMVEAELIAGATYTLKETAAPKGHVIANSVTFTVNADGTITRVAMQDDYTKIEINKVVK